jgi:hypothetical protein
MNTKVDMQKGNLKLLKKRMHKRKARAYNSCEVWECGIPQQTYFCNRLHVMNLLTVGRCNVSIKGIRHLTFFG